MKTAASLLVLAWFVVRPVALADDEGPLTCTGNDEKATVIAHLGDERIVVRQERTGDQAGAIELREYRLPGEPGKRVEGVGKTTTILSVDERLQKTAGKLRAERWRLAEKDLVSRGFSIVPLPYVARLDGGVMVSTQSPVRSVQPVSMPGDPAFSLVERQFVELEPIVHDETGTWQALSWLSANALWVPPSRRFVVVAFSDECQGTILRTEPIETLAFRPEPTQAACATQVTTSIVGFTKAGWPITRAEQTGSTSALSVGAGERNRLDVSGKDPAARQKRWDDAMKDLASSGATFSPGKPLETLPGGWKVGIRRLKRRERIDDAKPLRFTDHQTESTSLIAFRPGSNAWHELRSVPEGATVSELRLTPNGKSFAVAVSGPCVRLDAPPLELSRLK